MWEISSQSRLATPPLLSIRLVSEPLQVLHISTEASYASRFLWDQSNLSISLYYHSTSHSKLQHHAERRRTERRPLYPPQVVSSDVFVQQGCMLQTKPELLVRKCSAHLVLASVTYFLSLLATFFALHSSWTNRILSANDFGSVQVVVGDIDPATGKFAKTTNTYALCGFIRGHSEGDEALTDLVGRS
jgi:hypothetical protein